LREALDVVGRAIEVSADQMQGARAGAP